MGAHKDYFNNQDGKILIRDFLSILFFSFSSFAVRKDFIFFCSVKLTTIQDKKKYLKLIILLFLERKNISFVCLRESNEIFYRSFGTIFVKILDGGLGCKFVPIVRVGVKSV
jgi:hypothetical protein